MSNNIIKLTTEEIELINKLGSVYSRITAEFGQIKIEKILLKGQLSRLEELETSLTEEYLDNQTSEQLFAESIQKKYGEGEINLETGEFIPGSTSV
jgi:hypothetical protein